MPSLGQLGRSANMMICIDVTAFVERGFLGPFSRDMGRSDIESILGPSDPVSYPSFIAFGNLHFELARGDDPPCSPQVLYNHPTYDDDYTDLWPDPRVDWTFGRYRSGLTVSEFARMISPGDAIIIEGTRYPRGRWIDAHMNSSGVDITFESLHPDDEPTISRIVGYASWKKAETKAEP